MLQYRRIYVPADKIDAWPRDGEKLIPIESRDFDSLVHAANETDSERNPVVINSAEYTARIDTDGQLRGTGQWSIVTRSNGPLFLPLRNVSLVLENPHWQTAAGEPARIGALGQNNRIPGAEGLEVVRSDTLQFDWHLKSRSADDQMEFAWIVPPANSSRLTLDLPEGKEPRINGGVVLEAHQRLADDKTTSRPLRRWVIALSPSQSSILRIASADHKPSPTKSKTVLHEEIRYDIGPRGLEMTTVWRLEGPADQKRELTVAVPPGLQLSSLKSPEGNPEWRIIRDSASPTDTAIIELPKSDDPKSLSLTFNAWQPLVNGAPWRLPRLRPDGVAWSSGKFELSVASAHELKRLSPSDSIETGTARLSVGEDTPEIHSFTAYSPTAAIEIDLAKRQTDAVIRAGTSLTLADPNLNGRLVTQWNLSHGAAHQLVGTLARGWIVEALESVPADAMTEWFIDRRGNDQRIEIQLSRGATAARNVTIIVTARLQPFNLTEPLSAETMKIVKWESAKPSLHLLTFQSNEPYAVVPVGKLPERELTDTKASDHELLDESTDSKVFEITDAGRNAGLQLAVRRGQFAAHFDVDLAYENDSLRRDLRVSVEPASVPIDRVLIYSTVALGDTTRWIDRATNLPIAAEKLAPNAPQRGGLPKAGEAWLLRLAQPTSHSFEFSASITTKRPDNTLIPLLFAPEATQQDAQIQVRCRNQSSLWLEPSGLTQIPLPAEDRASDHGSLLPIVAAYRYQPTDCRNEATTPRLRCSATPDSKAIPLVARQVRIESFVWPNGNGTHSATYQLDHHGAVDLKFTIPTDARLVSASLDGHAIDVAKPTANAQATIIRLPAQTRPTRLSLFLETHGPPLAAGQALTPPFFVNELPFVAGEWTLWLPEEYSATGAGLAEASPYFNWRERLFGILGRPAGWRPFNPFHLADSAALVNGLAEGSTTGLPADATQSQLKSALSSSAGWRNYHESFTAGSQEPIVVLHPPAIAAWALTILLAAYAAGRWIRRKRAEAFVLVLALACAAALLLPFEYASLASGAVLGLLLSFIPGSRRQEFAPTEAASQSRSLSGITIATAIVLVAFITRLSFAEPPQAGRASTAAAPDKLYRLLIPADNEGHASGTKYYLSDDFLRALTSAAQTNHIKTQWLLSGATYTGELVEKQETGQSVSGKWTLSFAIETMARDTTVALPLNQGDAAWSSTAMLDGIPQPLEWRDNGRICTIEVPEPGRYSLALSCVPKTTAVNAGNQVELTVPAIRGAKIELRHPDAITGVAISHSSLLATSGPANAIVAELEQSNLLQVQWSRGDKSQNGASGSSLTELRFINVKPDNLELSIKYVLEGGARRPDPLTIVYDNRWKLITSEKSLNAQISADHSATETVIRIPVPAQAADRQEITMRWRLAEPPTFGHLHLPSIELTSAQPTKRWIAVSNDAALDCEIEDPSATEGTAKEFLTKWGDAAANEPPQWVLSNYDPSRAGMLAIRPRETESIVDESLNLAASLSTLRVNYDATITPGLAGAYRASLSVPANLRIDKMSVTEADRPIQVRWTRSAPTRVNIFFAQEVTKPYRLVLDGTTPIDMSGKAALPRISTLATEDATQKTRVYRDDNLSVTLDGLPKTSSAKADLPGPAPSGWNVRPVATCYLEADSAMASVSVSPSSTKISGETLTTLTRENGVWWANYRCQLTAEDGTLDVLGLQVPASCQAPFDVQSAQPVTTEFKPIDDQLGSLLIRLGTPIAKGGTVDLRIRSALKQPSNGGIGVPAITVETLSAGHRYVSVPESADSQAIAWSETGVRAAPLPPKLRPTTTASPTRTRTYEVVGDPFQVASQPPAAPEAAPQIRLADTAVIAAESGTQRITTRLILAPHGLTDCTLQLPDNQSLVSVELDGRPATIRQLDPAKCQVKLGAPQLPQSLEVISRKTDESRSARNVILSRPTLLSKDQPIPAEMSLWSFAHPQAAGTRRVTGADETSAVDQAALRFDRLVSIAEAARATAAELPSPDGYNWFQSWANMLTAARSQTQQTSTNPKLQTGESQVSHTAEDQITQAAARLDKWLADCRKILAPTQLGDAAAPAADTKPTSTLGSATSQDATADEWTYYVAEGGNDHLDLHFRLLGPSPNQMRLIGVIVVAASLITTLWIMRRPHVADFFYRWSHAGGVLVGIAWWAWLWPSWLGLVIAGASLWLALRFKWPGRSLRTEASTVLRASRTT